MQTRGSTNKSPIKLNTAENKLTRDLFMNGENQHGKNLTGWFLGHYSRESTIIKISGYK